MQLLTIVLLFIIAVAVVAFLMVPRKKVHKEVEPVSLHARKKRPRKRRAKNAVT